MNDQRPSGAVSRVTAVIGITDFAQSQLGDIVFVDVPTVGEKVFGSITATVRLSCPWAA